jgi:GAF domain-containing protein
MSAVPGPVDRAVGRLRRLCAVAVHTLPASGAGVSVYAENGQYSLLTAADPASERLEEMQFVLGEGPCVDATATGRPVLISDLRDESPSRWPVYRAAMHEAGIRAIFAFPLQVGAARLGVLDIFRTRPGPLVRTELVRAFQLTEQAVNILLTLQNPGPDGEPDAGSDPPAADATGDVGDGDDGDDGAVSVELFQAQGMVMVQLGCTLSEAMTRIRAYAYAEDRRLLDVARDIVARDLRFGGDE